MQYQYKISTIAKPLSYLFSSCVRVVFTIAQITYAAINDKMGQIIQNLRFIFERKIQLTIIMRMVLLIVPDNIDLHLGVLGKAQAFKNVKSLLYHNVLSLIVALFSLKLW